MRFIAAAILVALIGLPFTGNGQSNFSYGLTGGAGYNFTKLEKALNLNFSLGLRCEFKLGERADLRTGILAIQTGAREAPEGCLFALNVYCPEYTEYNFTFISVPINLKYDFVQGEERQYYLSFGFQPYFASRSVRKAYYPEPEGLQQKPGLNVSQINGYIYQRLLNFNCSPGIEFNISEKSKLQVELEIKYSLIEATSSIDDMFSAGIRFSLLHF